MAKAYQFTIKGTAANGQTWTASGSVHTDNGLMKAADMALGQAFRQLTQGKAVYGKPGVGCRGPYQVDAFLLEADGRPVAVAVADENECPHCHWGFYSASILAQHIREKH